MFNSPVLDVAIGLVFVFLLYSLLATSIKEAIATLFSLRAEMLKRGIVESMLSDTSTDFKLVSVVKGVKNFIVKPFYLMGLVPQKKEVRTKLGDKFYDHPLIKNYGASRIFPLPSYIPTDNFSAVLIDVLKQDFNNKIGEIAAYKDNPSNLLIGDVQKNLQNTSDVVKIKELLDYYFSLYSKSATLENVKPTVKEKISDLIKTKSPPVNSTILIDNDTLKILRMHLQDSIYDIAAFAKKLEDWFDDSMNRVSGWYKRQVQVILFILGFVMAIIFNVDTIQIADKLTTDKDARDKIVQLAIKSTEQYKDDPRIQSATNTDPKKEDTTIQKKREEIFKEYQSKLESVKNDLKGNVAVANNLLALGWNAYGRNDSLFLRVLLDKIWIGLFYMDDSKEVMDSVKKINIDSIKNHVKGYETTPGGDNSKLLSIFYDYQYKKYPAHVKTAYIWYSICNQPKKSLGFLILAFAVCLGAPFWFDLLNKLIKLRGTGKKEESDDDISSKTANTQQHPVNVNVNTQKTGEEAVG